MKLQDDKYSCGAVALYNALEAAGYTPPDVPALKKLCGTNATRGTTTNGIIKALRSLSIVHSKIHTKDRVLGYGAIIGALALGWPVLLAVDNDTHWVAAVGRLAARVLVADSADGAVVQSLDEKKLLDRAVCAGYIEGIVIGEKLAP